MEVNEYRTTADCRDTYEVGEYTALDFEHVTLETPVTDDDARCEACGIIETIGTAGIWSCPVCNHINHKDL